jgi:hypothetical protein
MDNNQFIPESDDKKIEVPFFEDIDQAGGWAGQGTRKDEIQLQAEVSAAVGRLGGMVTGWRRGQLGNRYGYQMYYSVQTPDGTLLPGRIQVFALPIRTDEDRQGFPTMKKKALLMSLYNLRDMLENQWRMQQLIPKYFALLPFMLDPGRDETFTERWVAEMSVANLLPEPSDSDDSVAVEAEFHETEE